MGKKEEEFEKMKNRTLSEVKEELDDLRDKIDRQNAKIRGLNRRVEDLEDKLLNEKEKNQRYEEKKKEYEKVREEIKEKVEIEKKGRTSELDGVVKKPAIDKNGFVDKYVSEVWKNDIDIRRRMFIVAKGNRFEEARQKESEWLLNVIGVMNRKKIREVRKMEGSTWYICESKELRDMIIEKRGEIKRQAWYKIDEVLTWKEREDRFNLKEFALTWGAEKEEFKIVDNMLEINGKKYRWSTEKGKVIKETD